MIGQGRPPAFPFARARTLARIGIAICLIAIVSPRAASAVDKLLEQPVRLRIAWGGAEERRCVGRITIQGGTFSDMQLLGLDADAPGSIWLEDGAIRVDLIRPHRFDGIDVTAAASEEAKILVELGDDPTVAPTPIEVPLSTAVRQPFRRSIGAASEILIHRAPGDQLRIETDRDSLIFEPGSEFRFSVRAVIDESAPGTTIDVSTTLSPARESTVLWSDQQRLPVPVDDRPTATLQVPLPRDEGVYQVRVAVSHPPGVRAAFFPIGGAKPLAERTFQVIVLNSSPTSHSGDADWQPVLEIDPANPRWWQRLPQWTQVQRIPGLSPRPLGSVTARSVDHPLGRFVELPRTTDGQEPHWQAYPLPIEKIGVPHLLEVEYPADEEQHFGLSIMEPNATGRIVPVGRDSGVYVEGLGRSEQTERHKQRVVFWPRTNAPLLLVTNMHPGATARFGRIRVLRSAGGVIGSRHRLPWRQSQRLVAAYISRPLVPEAFGASEGLDAASRTSAEDWRTHYEAARRLAEYLRFAGYNAGVVSVLADGSSIYPSQQLMPTPLYDTSRTVIGANDLPSTDALELQLHVFDREGLALIPTLQFAAPLPALEPLRRASDPRISGLEWVGGDGRTWLESRGTRRGLAPYYNLLHPQVEAAMLDVVRELVERYGRHPALAGLAVQLSGDGYAQLPGLEWGMDDATIAQFERETGIQLAAVGPNRFAARQAALLSTHVDAWRAWRIARVTRLYQQMAALLQTAGGEKRLLLTTEEMFTDPRLQTQLRPNLLDKSRLELLMQNVGIDRKRLEQTPGIVFCSAQFVAPTSPLVDRAIDLEINETIAAIKRPAHADQAQVAMYFQRPQRVRLASFDSKSGLDSYTLLVSQSSPDAAAVRKPLALTIAASDPALVINGGELLAMGQEDATRDLLTLLQQLPTQANPTVHRQQPVVLRTYPVPGGTIVVAINECPWRADVEVALDMPRDGELELLTSPPDATTPVAPPPAALAAGRQSWSFQLEPYGVAAARLSAAGAQVAAVRATVAAAARAELEAHLAELTERDLTAISKYEKLQNARFESSTTGEQLPGWKLVADPKSAAIAEIVADTPVAGSACLHFQTNGLAAVESHPFATPPTGQLAMEVWVRGQSLAPGTELRMIFEAERQGQPYHTFVTLGGNSPASQPIDGKWRYWVFGVNDVPLDSRGRMRIRFELSGPGEVWIDELQLYDVLFPLSTYGSAERERLELVKLVHAAKSTYEADRLADCVELLESYWPRFLMAYRPLVQPANANQSLAQPPSPAPPPDVQQPPAAPGLGERAKKWMFWR